MHDSLRTQLSELADYASGSARLDPPAALRQHGTRRGRRRRGGAALLGVGVVAAVCAVAGIAHPGVTGPDAARAPASSASSAQLTAHQTTVLAKAHVTKAQVAALARSGFTTAQISRLAAATARLPQQDRNALMTARIAAGYLARYLTPAERAALPAALHPGDMAQQIAALAKAHLSAAQLAALAAG
jgi:hypothetical protein